MVQVCKREACFGCKACLSVCKQGAISFEHDVYGFDYPVINQEKCVHCGLCQRVCPGDNTTEFHTPIKTYAAIAKNPDDYFSSTSGGVATAFSRKNLEDGNGIVYGAACMEGVVIKHIRITDPAEVSLLQGSKYVQSDMGAIYRSVANDLKRGKNILFIGTSCQNDALQKYLHGSYNNLILVNLICHGTPSLEFLRNDLEEAIHGPFDGCIVRFRDGKNNCIALQKDAETIYRKEFYKDLYYAAFCRSLSYRPACYQCKYAQKNRVGDITIGDFWGFRADKKPFVVKTDCGLSAVLLNTEKGEAFFDTCKDILTFQERETEEAVAGNKQLRFPSKVHRNRDKFLGLYPRYGFSSAVKKSLWLDLIAYRAIFAKYKIEAVFKKKMRST